MTELSNKKHRNPFDESLRQDYHKVRKKIKKLIKFKKTKLLNSKTDNLIKHKGNHEFWSYLKSLNEGDKNVTNGILETPIDKLHDMIILKICIQNQNLFHYLNSIGLF